MAREFKVLALLWLIVACLAVLGGAQDPAASTAPPSASPAEPSTAPPIEPSTAPPTEPSTAPTTEPSTAPPIEPSTAPPTEPSTAPPTEASTAPPTEPSTAPPTEASTAPPTEPSTALPTEPSTALPTEPSTALPTELPTESPATPPTEPPATPSTDPPTTPPPEPPTPDPCHGNPCGDGSTCEPRFNQTVCLCLAGAKYNVETGKCEIVKVFPGLLNLPAMPFDPNMKDKKSAEFRKASEDIDKELKIVFEDKGYSGSTVWELRSSKDPNVMSRSEDGTVIADVDISFNIKSVITTNEVNHELEIAKGCPDCLFKDSSFTDKNLCESKPCDYDTATCTSGNGTFTCTCVDKYLPTEYSDRICIACPSGEKSNGTDCILCDFGYSGFNCEEDWKLVLVIVGSVLGGLLLITLILLPVVALTSSKKSSKKKKSAETGKPYVSNAPAKAPLVNGSLGNGQAALVNGQANGLSTFANVGVPRIPRATTTNSWDSRTNLEMTPSNSRQNLLPGARNSRLFDSHDDMNPYAQARPQSGLYAQPRPQNNPYAQSRPQINPYAASQGNSNHSYLHDDGRRFN